MTRPKWMTKNDTRLAVNWMTSFFVTKSTQFPRVQKFFVISGLLSGTFIGQTISKLWMHLWLWSDFILLLSGLRFTIQQDVLKWQQNIRSPIHRRRKNWPMPAIVRWRLSLVFRFMFCRVSWSDELNERATFWSVTWCSSSQSRWVPNVRHFKLTVPPLTTASDLYTIMVGWYWPQQLLPPRRSQDKRSPATTSGAHQPSCPI